jgi:hypothetical protein
VTNRLGSCLEHCGAFIWAVLHGPFGVAFDSKLYPRQAGCGTAADGSRCEDLAREVTTVATVTPQFPLEWDHAPVKFTVRGLHIGLEYAHHQAEGLSRCGSVHALGYSPGANVTTAVTLVVGLPLAEEPAGLRRLLLLDLPAPGLAAMPRTAAGGSFSGVLAPGDRPINLYIYLILVRCKHSSQ